MTVYFKGRINFFVLVVLSLTLFSSSCRKVENTVGDSFVGDIVGFDVRSSDTTTLVAYTTNAEALNTKILTYYYLGDMNDPDFGTTHASAVVQFSLPGGAGISLAGKTIDSVVLQVKYVSAKAFYGNNNSTQHLRVYELGESISKDSSYKSDRNFIYDNQKPIGNWEGKFNNMGDSVKFSFAGTSVTLPPHLRIKLDDPAFMEKFRQGFTNNASLQNVFKGLVVSPETSPLIPGEGAVAFIDLKSGVFLNTTTSVVVYYDSVQKIEFPIYDEANAKSAMYTHETTVTIPVQPLLGGTAKEVNYVQSLGGLQTRIFMPNLFDFVRGKNIALTGAELIITAAEGLDAAPYTVPANLRVDDADEAGKTFYLMGNMQGNDYYGGTYNSTTKQYTFNIRNYIQYLLTRYKNTNENYNYGLNLYVPWYYTSASRVVLDTRPGKIKLKLSYTVIK
jgi:hypothetical protein